MAKNLRPFIADKLFSNALEATRGKLGTTREPNNVFDRDDASNIWLKFEGDKKCVQIVKVCSSILVSSSHIVARQCL